MSDRTMDRTTLVERMYRGYLGAHDQLVAGEHPSDIPALAVFSFGGDRVAAFWGFAGTPDTRD